VTRNGSHSNMKLRRIIKYLNNNNNINTIIIIIINGVTTAKSPTAVTAPNVTNTRTRDSKTKPHMMYLLKQKD